jgi:hypothetical protein
MLIPNHPDEERLAALASHEADAVADERLASHVASCHRCTTVIDELGALRAVLAELPDVAPSRPLRLLPPVEASPEPVGAGIGGWARRFFAPVLASGAALALVGTIGTAAPSLQGMASGGADSAAPAVQEQAAPAPAESNSAAGGAPADSLFGANPSTLPLRSSSDGAITGGAEAAPSAPAEGDDFAVTEDGADTGERISSEPQSPASPWPVALVAGVALMLGAVLLRYVVVPRAG